METKKAKKVYTNFYFWENSNPDQINWEKNALNYMAECKSRPIKYGTPCIGILYDEQFQQVIDFFMAFPTNEDTCYLIELWHETLPKDYLIRDFSFHPLPFDFFLRNNKFYYTAEDNYNGLMVIEKPVLYDPRIVKDVISFILYMSKEYNIEEKCFTKSLSLFKPHEFVNNTMLAYVSDVAKRQKVLCWNFRLNTQPYYYNITFPVFLSKDLQMFKHLKGSLIKESKAPDGDIIEQSGLQYKVHQTHGKEPWVEELFPNEQ